MRNIPLESIRAGSYLAKPIYDVDGRILLNSGAIITTNIIKRLRDLNVNSAYIIDGYSHFEIEEVIKPYLRLKAINLLKQTFSNLDRLASINPSFIDDTNVNDEDFLKSIHLLAEDLLNNILSNKNILFSLVDIKSMDFYTYEHSVNVAILSLVLGISLRLNKDDLLALCVGSLLHDIGKVFIPKEIITKEGPLTHDEFEIIKTHSIKGYNYLKEKDSISLDSKMIILQHHERVNGLGYPDGLSNDKINKFARIVAISDVYDALTSDRCYRKAMCASDALEYIMCHAGTLFDFDMVKIFAKIIVPFPLGTIVKLSNGDTGVVQETIPNFPLRPNIKIIKSSSQFKEGHIISLVNELSLVISSVEKNIC
ncbi:HD-GYP domain-containing protein [Clostridium carnis]